MKNRNRYILLIAVFLQGICLLVSGETKQSPYVASWDIYVNSWEKKQGALVIETVEGILKLRPYDFGALNVQLIPFAEKEDKSYAVIKDFQSVDFQVVEDEDNLTLATPQFKVVLQKFTGQISFYNAKNKQLLKEITNKRESFKGDSIVPKQLFQLTENEALFGLGQFRDNALNLRGKKRELVQFNTQAAVPVIYSTAGWGLLWDNPSRTVYEDTPKGMSFASDFGNKISYYVFVGESLDALVGSYRQLTGEAPMIPYWTLGYHQSRNKYATQDEILTVSEKMQQEQIQMSSIFVDYFYWQKYGTGSHRFDETLFPNPKGMLETLHNKYQTNVVITIWPTFKKGTPHYEELDAKGLLLNGARALDGVIYDVYNPEAREVYWKQILPLVNLGIDGWFLDGPEPDQVPSFLPVNTYAGPAQRVRNIYPLLHAENFYDHLVELHPNKRPYILTRCAWASQQRAGTAIWSGDIPTTFDELEKQVVAGLNFVATGIPYWTTDIGGYSGGDPASEEYRELFTRWFEYGTFCPVFRCHGRRYPGDTKAPNELWAYGKDVQAICTAYINLRYSLMPYIYTLTGDITHKNYTPMRLLAFDFPEDKNVLDCKDQFMYGPSLLVCPVLKAGFSSREVYLPAGYKWIDFWTGKSYTGGQRIAADAPKDKIPLYVKSGSIIPTYQDAKKSNTPDSPMKIFVYTGDNGSFELYKDDGDSFDYQKNNYAYIPFSWNDKTKELTIDSQKGNYNSGKTQTFQLVLVDGKQGGDINSLPVKKIIKYMGKKLSIKL
ncbi:glycoside hydrolase family 31 protein [Viscerimonas tarda]